MKRMMLGLVALLLATGMNAGTVNYTADDSSIFPNPERGFIIMIGGHLSESSPYGVKGQESNLESHKSSDKISLVLVHYYLDQYKDKEVIPTKVLNAFDTDMQVLRDKGIKAIIRFSYTESSSGDDAPLSIVQKHVAQYKSHWEANSDVIFCFQAGIIGAWGEWYYTQHYGDQSSTITASRRAVLDTLLKAVPADRCIQIRTPLFKTGYIGNTKALTAAEAYQNTPKARIGHHNDAFLYDYDNMGTYSDTSKQKPYLAQETLYVPMGGETDIEDLNKAKKWATYEKTTAEMSRLHWTFIQSEYAPTTINYWRGNGTFDELNRKMGYRYQLVSGTYGEEVAQGGKLSVKMTIKNVGYAPLYNFRPAYVVLKNNSKSYAMPLASDPRGWLPNGAVTTINEQLTLPSGELPAGTYDLYLYLPDAYATLADDPRFAVRFANEGVWEASTGMNNLNASVTVTSEGADPDPGPTPDPDPQPGDAIVLPATLNKANVKEYSEDMTWYNTDYFDYGPTDAVNTGRWAEWKVELKYQGKYELTEEYYCENGHGWKFQLLDGSNSVSSYETGALEGNTSPRVFANKWDLSGVAPKVYTLRITNVREWSQPKLKSLTLTYDGDIPTDEKLPETDIKEDGRMFDILGRPVDASYHGIVIMRGRKMLR